MNTIDLTPLYRTMVGFDRMAGMIDKAQRLDGAAGYPPYNIQRAGDDAFAIELAVAGFAEGDLDIETNDGVLTVAGKKAAAAKSDDADNDTGTEYLHRGIAERSFIRRFQLADHVIVTGAELENGILRIDLVREVPEAKKPRKIAIGGMVEGAAKPKLVEKEVS